MTEKEARLKRCCGPEGCGWVCPNDDERYCVASDCMAWSLDKTKWKTINGTRIHDHGYCGLANN